MKTPSPMLRWFLVTIGLMLMTTIAARADYHSTVLADNPLAYYPINATVDPTGITATDLSGNGNDGTYNGTDPEFNTVPGPSSFIPSGLYFDGFTSYVDLSTGGNTAILNFGGPISMEAWVQPANPNQNLGDILAKGYDQSINSSEISLRLTGGKYEGTTYSDSAGGKGASGGKPTTDWAHVVATFDSGNWKIYVNGQLLGQGADTVGAINFTTPWQIGRGSANGANRMFVGNITEVALYNYGLSSNQILNHFFIGELGVSPNSAPPIIVTQPESQASYVGGSATFTVGAVSGLPTTNQWYKGSNPITGQTNATLILANLQLGDAADYSVVVGNANGTTNSVLATLSVSTPKSLRWSANANSGVWNTGDAANWVDLSNDQQVVFNSGDQVLFDDTPGVPLTVSISGSISPSAIVVDSSANIFTTSGGTISGSGGLTKKGSSTLTILSAGNFTGPVSISGGSIYAGNNCFASVSSITITNDGTLDLGGGTFSGKKPITISGNGVNGSGAINNSYDDYPVQSVSITLTGDATLGASKRWDIAAGSFIGGPHSLIMDLTGATYSEWNSTTIGSNVVNIVLTNGNFGAKSMSSSFQNPGTMFTVSPNRQLYFWGNGDGWNGSIHLLNGAQIQHFGAPAGFNGSNIILETGADFVSYGNTNADAATPVNSLITLNGVVRFEIGDHNLIFTNLISGPGGFIWNNWNHQMVLSASNTYAGPTVLGDGPQIALVGDGSISHSSLIFFGGNNAGSTHLDATGRPDQTFTLASGQTLAGVGSVNGNLVVSPGAIISPAGTNTTLDITAGANAVGTLAAANNVTLAGTTILKLNGSGVNDQIQAGAGITYGGTLNLVNISGAPFAIGDSFELFSASSRNGSFVSITPATPGPGLAWDFSQLNIGFVNVVASGGSAPTIGNTHISGGNLIFSGTGGTADGSYVVLVTTNLATPVANWTPVVTNSFDGLGAFSVTNDISAGASQQFYRIKQLP